MERRDVLERGQPGSPRGHKFRWRNPARRVLGMQSGPTLGDSAVRGVSPGAGDGSRNAKSAPRPPEPRHDGEHGVGPNAAGRAVPDNDCGGHHGIGEARRGDHRLAYVARAAGDLEDRLAVVADQPSNEAVAQSALAVEDDDWVGHTPSLTTRGRALERRS